MSHGPSTDWGVDKAAGKKTRLGTQLFIVYAFVYAAFVIANTLSPEFMATVIFGQSLAVVYGLGLIAFALILALIYNRASNRAEAQLNGAQTLGEEESS